MIMMHFQAKFVPLIKWAIASGVVFSVYLYGSGEIFGKKQKIIWWWKLWVKV